MWARMSPIFLLTALAIHAQTAGPQYTGSISGRVTNSVSGAGIEGDPACDARL